VDAIPAVERDIALDLVKRGLLVSPLVVLIAGLISGFEGAIGAALGIAIVLANFLAAACIVSWAARRSPQAAGVAALSGYVVRLAVIVCALFLLRDVSWLDFATLGITVVVTHIGLLTWEARHVALSLAAPGLRPARPAAVSGDE
jgi:hypothetical protein